MDKHFSAISRNAFLLILILLLALSIAILLSYVLVPSVNSFVQAKDSFSALSAELEQVNESQPEMEQARASISELKQQVDNQGNQLPPQQFESRVISELQHIAWKNSIELGGVRPRSGQAIDHYRQMLFDVELFGEYFDLYRLLLDLEQAPGFLIVNELSISPRPSIKSSSELEVRMTIASYLQEGQ